LRGRWGRWGTRRANPQHGSLLATLVPKAIQVLEEHLNSGRPDAWRSAYRILEHSWGRPPEHVAPEPWTGDGELDFEKMSTAELQTFLRRSRERRQLALEDEPPDDADTVPELAGQPR
jgi:hypothetical protein